MKFLSKIFGLLWISHMVHAGVIYGVDQIQDKYQRVHYPVYVQIGSFSTIYAAKQLQHQMRVGLKVPAVVQFSHGRYKVMTGPFRNHSALSAFAHKMVNNKAQQASKPHTGGDLLLMPLRSEVASIPALKPIPADLSATPVLPRRHAVSIYAVQKGSHPELSIFLGGSYIPNSIEGQTLQLLPYEIGQYADTFTHQSSAGAFTWGVDALYRFKFHAPSTQDYFFDSLGAGIDVFQITNFKQTGNVLQFNLPEFENYTYILKLNNIRVMANFDLDFQPIRHYLTPFIQAGIGYARTAVAYNSAPISPVLGPNFTLPSEVSWNFAYQAGGGVKYVVKSYPHFVLSLRYLYANMGKANSSTLGSATTLAAPLTVSMSTQNFLLGLTYLVE